MEYILTLPYPISANRYWRTRVIPKRVHHKTVHLPMHYLSPEAVQFKTTVKTIYLSKKFPRLPGKVDIEWWLYPHRPQDWAKRQKNDFQNWEMSVQQLDIDNVNKVLLDALKDTAFHDDKWVRNLYTHMMEPDGKGERLVVSIQPTEAKIREELFA